MKFVCIIGRHNSFNKDVEKTLEKMDFKICMPYTTDNHENKVSNSSNDFINYKYVTKDKFNELVNKNRVIKYAERGYYLYGAQRPYGAKKFVAVVEEDCCNKLKEVYGNQIIEVYIKEENEPDNGESDININIDNIDVNRAVAEIIKVVKERQD
jgi:glycine/serine hydroxymethyltransferase